MKNKDRCFYCTFVNKCDEIDEDCNDVEYELDDTNMYMRGTWGEMSFNKYVGTILEK